MATTGTGEGVMARATDLSLRHLLVVGGTLAEWAELSEERWAQRLSVLGELCQRLGVPWLTIRAYEEGADQPVRPNPVRRYRVGACEVIADPSPDGRRRFSPRPWGASTPMTR